MTPVEQTATRSSVDAAGHRRRALHLGRLVEAAPAGGGVGVAGVDRDGPQRVRRARSRVTSTGGAAGPSA